MLYPMGFWIVQMQLFCCHFIELIENYEPDNGHDR